MTPPTPQEAEIAGVAERLTKAQREAILRLDREWRFLGLASRPDKCRPVIERFSKPYGGFNYRLTPLGLQVKAHLQRTQGESQARAKETPDAE